MNEIAQKSSYSDLPKMSESNESIAEENNIDPLKIVNLEVKKEDSNTQLEENEVRNDLEVLRIIKTHHGNREETVAE